jgi:hypothetical protein
MTFRAHHMVSILLAAGVLALGAHFLVRGGTSSAAPAGDGPVTQATSVQADSDFRAAATAATAYFADNGSYDGMTTDALRASYDAALPNDVVVAAAAGASYCLQANVVGTEYSEHGPGGPVAPGAC